ncbi:MAG: FKBP-type peptidyl-prolyl cis-trans isomerase [Proteobacteria bacterium]|nr:FKBP-type peptidyl-prolyl cis-trans isomerase [Pseudomonadota bacterium]MBU1714700.1 FKBP-type peptidyl-prolyl cis-trans isomerase [Pseudomonadota bacterium]
MKRIFILLLMGVFMSAANGMAAEMATAMIKTTSGLRYVDQQVDDGAEAVAGKTVQVHYTGWLNDQDQKGKKFDSSVDRGQQFSFSLGAGQVIKGWDEGVAGMKIGGKRTLYIPANLGYGARGAGGVIPPNADLIFDVELFGLK